MGNCCCPESAEQQTLTGGRRPQPQAFTGQGHRLGTADETSNQAKLQQQIYSDRADEAAASAPPPAAVALNDPHLTEEQRAQIRADRAAAAEARLKKQGGLPKKPKPQKTELVGPNSQPTMRWTAG